ncbi:SurA N-terminal domain-containing protein [Marinobacter sp. 2_MG-2023]|uniref:SurA N-terminal domain-containing protein n=1 Tax=Marinobacter sp. 2_MG-2023 TaxID=3062679 RepID=UPI0026E197BA|nr:SurA N-terminal domain-containing protein [Marinobacter sp. 2_MG-2023]MDO6440649.1 SurA N-terminal domain-containing protein [Marinobacter sp. 2_MG-2023]
MLQDIRENSQGTIAKIIIGLLVVSLSIWGMDAIVGGFSGEPEVATVNGEDITEREFLRVVQMESQRRLSAMERPDPAMLNEDQIRKDVLDSLVQEQVLIQDASAQGLALTDADIDALITQMPQFQVDGQFNRDRFVASVRNLGMGVGEFREAMRKQYVVNQIRGGIMQSGLVADANASQLLRIQNQTRNFRVVQIPASAVSEGVEVTDAEIEAFYQENKNAFSQPEQIDAAYITLSLGALAEKIEISQEELEAYYAQRAGDLAREERRASHILIEDGADSEQTMVAIQERLEAGESFEDLAQELSIDTVSAKEGGDLGFAGRGVYDEAFEEALFALEEGEVSGPVQTSFGVHLIRLDDVRRSEVPPMEELEQQLRTELARERAQERYAEVRSELADSAYAADDLIGPAEELGLEIRVAEAVTREGGQAPFDHAGLVRQLFSEDVMESGYNTELIDVGDNVSVVARAREYREAQQLPLADVQDSIRSNLEDRKIREALNERAQNILASLEKGESLDSLNAGDWEQFENQARDAGGVEPQVVQTVFSLSRPGDSGSSYGIAMTRSGVAVIALDAVNEGDAEGSDADLGQLRRFMASLEGQREYAAYQQFLRSNAEVSRP